MGNYFKTVLLLGALTGLMLLIGSYFGQGGLTIAIVIVLAMNLITYFFSDKIVLFTYRAKEAKKSDYPKLHKLVEKVAKLANIPKPKVYIIPSKSPNAFATGRNPRNAAVACTEGIMDILDDKELEGVIAHEISHVKNRDILIATIAATIAGVISYAAMMARWAAIFGGIGGRDRDNNGLEVLFLAILAPIIAVIIQLAISRSREYLADEKAARLIGNGKGLADALEKLERNIDHNPLRFGNKTSASLFIANPFRAQSLLTLFSTHPKTEDRVRRLRTL
ncbi:zinc metalloprotease HtpX [Candidatus Woesearchaeota archaeon]|nr:zinc metalloprotease HtpX [Candidatus Woesearchaeota archaeon]